MTDNQAEKMEAYCSGEMTPDEQISFEQELKADTTLAAAFDTYRTIELHMTSTENDTREATLKGSLAKLGDEFFKTESNTHAVNAQKKESPVIKPVFSHPSAKRSVRLMNIPVGQIAAAILFGMLLVGAWFILKTKQNTKEQVIITPATIHDSTGRPKSSLDSLSQIPPSLAKKDTESAATPIILVPEKLSNEQLFTKYFEPDAAPANQEEPLEEAFDQYEKRQYANAAAAFENIDFYDLTRGPATDTLLTRFYASYYKAVSYMAVGKYVKAALLLEGLSSPNPLLKVKVQWFLALAYLRTGNLPKAAFLLRAIEESNGKYRAKVHQLLTELNH